MERDAKDGKQDARITGHLIDNFDYIMGLAAEKEKEVLDQKAAMEEEFEALSHSESLTKFFK